MKKKDILYRVFVIFMAGIMIASTCCIVASFFVSPAEPEDPRANLTEEEYAQLLAEENSMALKALNYISKQKNTTRFSLMHGRIGKCKKISQMLVGKEGQYYVKLEYSNIDGGDNIVLTYYGKGTGNVSSADLYDSKLREFRVAGNASDMFADGSIDNENYELERHVEGEDLEILLKYWKGEYDSDGVDNMQ
ncbi:MAG: hypothetical protein E7678_02970 [Ruminococcaceae bacterium]|nr:hypothetical protein [Oscillospiraceae bacterium]